MKALEQHLLCQGKQLVDASGQGNNCCLYVVASRVFGIDSMGRDEFSRKVVHKLRKRTAAYLAQQLAAESRGFWAVALAAQAGIAADSDGALEAAEDHIQKLMEDAPYSMADLAGEQRPAALVCRFLESGHCLHCVGM
jgi:hypothetical protein